MVHRVLAASALLLLVPLVAACGNGDDELLPSEPTSIPVTVVKKATSPKVSGAAAVVKGKSLAVKVGVAGMVAGTYPTGTVTVQAKFGSGAWKTVATKITITAVIRARPPTAASRLDRFPGKGNPCRPRCGRSTVSAVHRAPSQ